MNEPLETPTNEPTETKPAAPLSRKSPKLSPTMGAADTALMKWFVGLGMMIFFVTLILWTTSLTMGIMNIVMPGNAAAKYFAIALFDGGALVWLGVYIYKAKGTPQRGIALLMFVMDLLGVVLMAVGGVYMGGQKLTDIPSWLGATLINGVIFATLANVSAWYYYEISNPDTREAMQAQSLEDTLTEEAMSQARANIQREARSLGTIMARRATARIKYRLSLPMTENESSEWEGETVEGEEVQQQAQLPAPTEVPAWVVSLFRFFGKGSLSPKQSEPTTTSPSSD